MRCASCGTELEKGARFCHICGQPAPTAEAVNRFCIRCGAKLPSGAAFCPSCGAPVSAAHMQQTPAPAQPVRAPAHEPAPVQPAPAPLPVREPVHEPAPAPQPARTPAHETPPAQPEPRQAKPSAAPRPAAPKKKAGKKKRRRSSGNGAGVVVLVILVAALLFGSLCAFLFAEANERGLSVREYIASRGGREAIETPARWSDLKDAAPAAAVSEQEKRLLTKDVCEIYIELLEGRRERIERYDWQRTGSSGLSRQVVLCDICADNVPELVWVEATDEENVRASTLNIAGIRDGEAAVLCSVPWDVQAGGGYRYHLFQEQNSKALYAFCTFEEETWTVCYSVFAEQGGALEQEELLKSVLSQGGDGENSWESTVYTKMGEEVSLEDWSGAVESLMTGMESILMYSAEAGSFAADYAAQNGCPAMGVGEALSFLAQCRDAVS